MVLQWYLTTSLYSLERGYQDSSQQGATQYGVDQGFQDVEQYAQWGAPPPYSAEHYEHQVAAAQYGADCQEHQGAAVNKQAGPQRKDKGQSRIPEQTPQPFEVERFDFDFQQESVGDTSLNQYPLAT